MDVSTKNINFQPDIYTTLAKTPTKYRLNKVQQLRTDAEAHLNQSQTLEAKINVTLTKHEKLLVLKEAYFKALESCNELYSEENFVRLRDAERAYMMCFASNDLLALDS